MLPKGYTLFKFLLPDRTTAYFLDPLLPDRVWFLPFCSQTGVSKLRKMLPDRVKITAPQRHTPVHIRTKCPPRGFTAGIQGTHCHKSKIPVQVTAAARNQYYQYPLSPSSKYEPCCFFADVSNHTNLLPIQRKYVTFLEDCIFLWPEWFLTYIHICTNQWKIDTSNKGQKSRNFVIEFMVSKGLKWEGTEEMMWESYSVCVTGVMTI